MWSFSESDDRGEGSIELIVNLIRIENGGGAGWMMGGVGRMVGLVVATRCVVNGQKRRCVHTVYDYLAGSNE